MVILPLVTLAERLQLSFVNSTMLRLLLLELVTILTKLSLQALLGIRQVTW